MEIILDDFSAQQYHKGHPRGTSDINEFDIHATGGIGYVNLLRNKKMGRDSEYVQGISLPEFVIERSGRIVQLINDDRFYYHSSSGLTRGNPSADHDSHTIGVEIENERLNGAFEYIQYESLFFLLFNRVMSNHKIKVVTGHSWVFKHWSPGAWEGFKKQNGYYYSCPGTKFDWSILTDFFSANKISFTQDELEHIIVEGV